VTVTGAALVLGHCFSAYLRGRGGKGVASSFGCLVAVAPWMAFFSALTYLILLIATHVSAVGSLSGLVVTWIYLAFVRPPREVSILVAAISTIVIIRHRTNINRFIGRLKARFGK